MTLAFRNTLVRWIPGYFKNSRIFRFLYTLATLADAGTQIAIEGLQARMPGVGTFSALPMIGRDRKITRGYAEPPIPYGTRLQNFRKYHRTKGNPFTIMRMVRDYVYPNRPLMRIVNNQGTWYTLNPDDTENTHYGENWNWDGAVLPTGISRFWLIIYQNGDPWSSSLEWGTNPDWGQSGYSWGSTATGDQVATVRAIVEDWRSATALCSHIIIAFDPASFDPTAAPGAPLPDGTWGVTSKIVGGVAVPTRLDSALYWDGR